MSTLEYGFLYLQHGLHIIKEEDTFHDSGTSGHEPDSLEAIETLVSGETKNVEEIQNESLINEVKESDAVVLLHLERCAHRQTRKSLQEAKMRWENIRNPHSQIRSSSFQQMANQDGELQNEQEINIFSLESLNSVTSSDPLNEKLKIKEMTISQLQRRVLMLEKTRLDKVPVDAAKEISRLASSVIQIEMDRDEVTLQNFTLKAKLADLTTCLSDPAATYQINKDSYFNIKENILAEIDENENKLIKMATYKVSSESKKLRQLYSEFNEKEEKYKNKISDLETNLKNQQNNTIREYDHSIRVLEEKLDESLHKNDSTHRYMMSKEEEYNSIKLDFETLREDNSRLRSHLNELMSLDKDNKCKISEYKNLEQNLKRIEENNRLLEEDYNRERILRKRYYNQVEELKGKIRVYCRIRPVSELERNNGDDVVAYPEDEFSLLLDTNKGRKNFLFDKVFNKGDDQLKIFEDTRALVQSAVDGFNVTIMAYGQTGSGKTFTMLGNSENPGIAPRAFNRIFELSEELQDRQEVSVCAYMLELYNDKLIDLLKANGYCENDKLEIKRDKKGCIYVVGAVTRSVSSSAALNRVFEEGLANRHTACTKLNLQSSRSHLLITVMVTATSKQTGSTTRGKLTLIDLAGSERINKSGVTNDQLKEANSINKSLSALGDVIAALSSDSSFVPYRNSKLTMLLQDSIGGNAKTLVFVNISPASYNGDETLVSLMYASRIRQITNNAMKNGENKEISRLKATIAKLKKGEEIEEDL